MRHYPRLFVAEKSVIAVYLCRQPETAADMGDSGGQRNMEHEGDKMQKIMIAIYRKRQANIVDVLTAGLLILAMTIIMTAYLGSMQLVSIKSEMSQLSRKYILRMESVGCLTEGDRISLEQELHDLGIKNVDLSGTTMSETGYGNPIFLVIRGCFGGQETLTDKGILSAALQEKKYAFTERRMSTAKN